MFRKLLKKLGYIKFDYGCSCGRHWIELDGKMLVQLHSADHYMLDEDVEKLAKLLGSLDNYD